jgi:hypothetical protein
MGKLRVRFWVEVGMTSITTILLIMTLISREWIEALFGVDPDGGDGSLEWAIVGVLAAVSLVFSLMARGEWRRRTTSAAR